MGPDQTDMSDTLSDVASHADLARSSSGHVTDDAGSATPSLDAPMTPLTQGGGGGVQVWCMTCGETVCFGESRATGPRNPLKRVCNVCCSTDKSLSRAAKPKKGTNEKDMTEEEKNKITARARAERPTNSRGDRQTAHVHV